jgi:hypothetical protein
LPDLFFEELIVALARRLKLPTQELSGKKQSMAMLMLMMLMLMIHSIHGRARKQRCRKNHTGMEAIAAQESESLSLSGAGI